MGSDAKKKKRLGIGVYRICKDALGRRLVLQVFSKDPIISPSYFENLSDDLYHEAKALQKCARASMEFALPKIEYDIKIFTDDNATSFVFNGVSDYEYNGALRIVVCSDGIDVNVNTANELLNIAIITAVKNRITPIFDSDTVYPETIRAKLHVSDAIKYAKYFFMDIMMANSDPISSVIKKFVSNNGHETLFKRKVNFAINMFSGKSCFGDISDDASYVSFASLCEIAGTFDYDKYIDVWDDFVMEELQGYLLNQEEIFHYLNTRRGHENQINRSVLFGLLSRLKKGPNVIVLPYERPSKPEHFEEAMSKYGFSSNCQKNWHREIGFSGWKEFKQLERCLVENKTLEPFKIITGG